MIKKIENFIFYVKLFLVSLLALLFGAGFAFLVGFIQSSDVQAALMVVAIVLSLLVASWAYFKRESLGYNTNYTDQLISVFGGISALSIVFSVIIFTGIYVSKENNKLDASVEKSVLFAEEEFETTGSYPQTIPFLDKSQVIALNDSTIEVVFKMPEGISLDDEDGSLIIKDGQLVKIENCNCDNSRKLIEYN